MSEPKISTDARSLLSAWWPFPGFTTVDVGGASAKSMLTERAQLALSELVDAGYITSSSISDDGRMRFTGTGKRGNRLGSKQMQRYGRWSATKPNPNASEDSKAKSTMSLSFRSGEQG